MKGLIGFVVMVGLLGALAAPVFATECTGLIAKVEEKLSTAEISEAREQKVVELLEEGTELHEAGEHDKAVAVLKEALGMLGM